MAARLAAAGVPDAAADARILAQAAFGLDRAGLLAARDSRPDAAAIERYGALTARRAAREPVSRILGRREFWSLDFALSPATLDPRPDSETLVEAALAGLPDRQEGLLILDLGTGSGCLLLALLSALPAARGLGIDRSVEALATARENARRLGLAGRAAFAATDWAAGLAGRFDLVVANPPYVTAAEMAALAPEVAGFDPHAALDGGADGLDAYRAIAPALPGLLGESGRALLEIAPDQWVAVSGLLEGSGLRPAIVHFDLAGRARCLETRRCSAKKEVGFAFECR
jgi:release factor glutamine methyltransferase